jgi:hypothetical protein
MTRKNRLSNWRAKLKREGRLDAPAPERKDSRWPEAIESEVKAKAQMTPGQILLGVEWHGASLNTILPSWDEFARMADEIETVVVPKFIELEKDPRERIKSSVMTMLYTNEHQKEDQGVVVIKLIAWLMQKPLLDLGDRRPSIMGARYVITDQHVDRAGNVEANWRLLVEYAA